MRPLHRCSRTVEQEVASSRSGEKTPLCMEQYFRVFSAYRQPGAGQDVQVVQDAHAARDSEHVIVVGNKGQVTARERERDTVWCSG